MKYTKMFIPTLRETPSDAEAVSHKLMLRAGFVRQLAAGLYVYLPLGWRVIKRINAILKEEMDAIGAQELSMPVLHPDEPWKQTGRWDDIGEEMFRLKDRAGRDMCLGMTHEEIMTWLASGEIRSYRDLPQMWYQIQTKMRDEARPKSGVLRTREFLMKDSYSFDVDDKALEHSYRLHAAAYHKIFKRCGLTFYQVDSDPGMMGGAMAHEFMAPSPAGEDDVALCAKCGYASNVELAVSVPKSFDPSPTDFQKVHTPNRRTVQEVTNFFKCEPEALLKSLLLITSDSTPVLALVRGDQELHERKAQRILGEFRPATKDEIKEILGVEAGFIGPIDQKVKTIADPVLKQGSYICGANEKDHHVKGVKAGEHFEPEWHDLHMAKAGDGCPKCNETMDVLRSIEIGNIFKLGTKYSSALGANYLDEDGAEHPIVMGSYGIGPARIAAAAVEQSNDKHGIIWPEAIAPFDVQITPVNVNHAESMKVAESLYAELIALGMDVLLDDRDERAGVKFKDADLIGIPKHIIIGERNLKDGLVELKSRKTGEAIKIKPEEVVKELGK